MRKRHVVFALFFCVVAMISIGCSKDNNPFDPEETIIFENRTGVNGMNCFIDGVLKGAVNNGENLNVEGDYEGDRVLSVRAGSLVASRVQHIDNGMTFIYTLSR
ncbi:MAG: hypothetical protein ACYC9Y_11755 [Candidatus Methylomirabilia bacterium]